MTKNDLKELVPVIGDRVGVRELLQRERKVILLILQGVKADLVFVYFALCGMHCCFSLLHAGLEFFSSERMMLYCIYSQHDWKHAYVSLTNVKYL